MISDISFIFRRAIFFVWIFLWVIFWIHCDDCIRYIYIYISVSLISGFSRDGSYSFEMATSFLLGLVREGVDLRTYLGIWKCLIMVSLVFL